MQTQLATSKDVQQEINENIVDILSFQFDDLTIGARVEFSLQSVGDNWSQCAIDASNANLMLPKKSHWGDICSQRRAKESIGLVRRFRVHLCIPKTANRQILVTQREAGNKYGSLFGKNDGELRLFSTPQFAVMSNARSSGLQKFEQAGPIVVYTANKAQTNSGSNRVDIWSVKPNGMIQTMQIVVQTYDDGKSFQLIPEMHGEWKAQRLPTPLPYQPTANTEVYGDHEVSALARQIIFVPEDGFPGFDQKAQMLLVPAFRSYLNSNLDNFRVWRNQERNIDPKFAEAVHFKDTNKGVVKFWDKTRAGGLGIIEYLDGNDVLQSRQFTLRSFAQDYDFADDYGQPDVKRGDHVMWASEYDVAADPEARRLKMPLVDGLVITHQTTL